MDYEEALLQITDVLKAHNRYHMNTPDHEQAVKLIREIVTPKGKWEYIGQSEVTGLKVVECTNCHKRQYGSMNYCGNCGADMRGYV